MYTKCAAQRSLEFYFTLLYFILCIGIAAFVCPDVTRLELPRSVKEKIAAEIHNLCIYLSNLKKPLAVLALIKIKPHM